MDTTEEQQLSRGGINNYYYGGVQKVVNLSMDKKVFEKAVGKVVLSGGKFDIEELLDLWLKNEKPHTQKHTETKYAHEGTNNEELFHFIHPEVEEEEAWRIHQAIKRTVANQKPPEICAYLNELKQKGKVMLPPSPSIMYNELVRLGMPTGKGFSEKYFSSCYIK